VLRSHRKKARTSGERFVCKLRWIEVEFALESAFALLRMPGFSRVRFNINHSKRNNTAKHRKRNA
jgi:hypothetical protein